MALISFHVCTHSIFGEKPLSFFFFFRFLSFLDGGREPNTLRIQNTQTPSKYCHSISNIEEESSKKEQKKKDDDLMLESNDGSCIKSVTLTFLAVLLERHKYTKPYHTREKKNIISASAIFIDNKCFDVITTF